MTSLPGRPTTRRNVICLFALLATFATMVACTDPTTRDIPSTGAVATTPTLRTADRVISLPNGGVLVIPAEASQTIKDIETWLTCLPLMPRRVEPMGQAVHIYAETSPSQPATLRLPLPPDASDPYSLTIIRVEPNGHTTFLVTKIDNEELVAATPGFGTFVIGRLLEQKVSLIGADKLMAGQRQGFYPLAVSPLLVEEMAWSATGALSIVSEDDRGALVQAATIPQWGTVTCQFVDRITGRHWYGHRQVQIISPAQVKSEEPFFILLNKMPAVGHAGEVIQFSADVHGQFAPPLIWSWDFGDGESGGPVTENGATTYALPPKQYAKADSVNEYTVKVTATDAQNRTVSRQITMRVYAKPTIELALVGPQRLGWVRPGVSAAYTASASGGTPPYNYVWLANPGEHFAEEIGATSAQMFTLTEPGEHEVISIAYDSQDPVNSAAVVLFTLVEDRDPLNANISGLPPTATAGQRLDIKAQMMGGVLVVSGQKGGYTVTVNWGDGSEPLLEREVGMESTSLDGATLPAAHTYATPGTYTIRLEVCDATGWTAFDEQPITITAASGAAPIQGAPAPTATVPSPAAGEPTHTATPTASSTPTVTGTTTAVPTGTSTATPTNTVTPTPTKGILVWVRDKSPIINGNNDPTEIVATEPRFDGTFAEWTVMEDSIIVDDRYVDHGFEYHNITIACDFDIPPEIVIPGTNYDLQAIFSHGGTVTQGNPGWRFWYSAESGYQSYIQPNTVLHYFPWDVNYAGVNTKTWTLTGPTIYNQGDTFQMYAGWWNCAPCNVTWTYRAEYRSP